ncbi:MAG TPA: elongation factor Ts [Cytophagales bacterium]|jgi:elongation factor Ts|nr:elongation factor Ts [Cytophagales bacterium]
MGVNISAKEVNELRKKTGSGMMDCKKALVEAEGDFQKAIDILRKKGQKVSVARSNRETSEGVVLCKLNSDESQASILSFTCETDFVAKNEDFQSLAQDIMEVAFENNLESIDEVLASEINGSTIEQLILEMVGKIGEKIKILDFQIMSGEKIVPYVHAGSKLGVLVSLNNTANTDYVTAGKDIAMQIAAMNPIALDRNQVDQSVVEKEIEIGKEQARKEGKPEQIIEKIAQGKLQKFFKENTLLSQSFVKDNSLTIKSYLATFSPELSIESFIRISIG